MNKDREPPGRLTRVDLDVLLGRMTPETYPDVIDFGVPVGGETDADDSEAKAE